MNEVIVLKPLILHSKIANVRNFNLEKKPVVIVAVQL